MKSRPGGSLEVGIFSDSSASAVNCPSVPRALGAGAPGQTLDPGGSARSGEPPVALGLLRSNDVRSSRAHRIAIAVVIVAAPVAACGRRDADPPTASSVRGPAQQQRQAALRAARVWT